MRNYRSKNTVINLNRLRKHLGIFYLLLVIQRIDSLREFRRRLMRFNLELIGLTLLSRLLLVADFNKDKFAKLAKSSGRRKTTTAPQSLMTLFDRCNQVLACDRPDIVGSTFIKTILLNLSILLRQIRNNIFFSFKDAILVRYF